VWPAEEYRQALQHLLNRMMAINADVVVAEAGASPLEPYNGATAIAELKQNVLPCTRSCA
jgi:hypothetical protein